MNIKFHLLIILIVQLFSALVYSESPTDTKAGKLSWIKWLEDNGFLLRKTFDGSKNESEPANFSYVNPPGSDNSYFNMDLAAKITEWDSYIGDSNLLVLFPSIEWHVSAQEDPTKRVNKASFKGSSELYIGDLTKIVLGPRFLFKGGWERDFHADKTGSSVGLLFTLGSIQKWLPSSLIRDSGGRLKLLYYPYTGFEYFDNPENQKDLIPQVDITTFTSKIVVFFYPISFAPASPDQPSKPRLEIAVEYTLRKRVGGDDVDDVLDLILVGVTCYFDESQHFGVGYEYESGHNPVNNFLERTKSSIALKIRF